MSEKFDKTHKTYTEISTAGKVKSHYPEQETWYHYLTVPTVAKILESAMKTRERMRIFYGDSDTGKDWCEEYDTMGYVGRSTGTRKIPLLVHNERSYGGGAILDHCIVKIVRTSDSRVLWQHGKYHQPKYTLDSANESLCKKGLVASVFADGKNVANFASFGQAENWIKFITGKRMRK